MVETTSALGGWPAQRISADAGIPTSKENDSWRIDGRTPHDPPASSAPVL